jgi:glycerol-3-phosphate dehydrogenase
MWTKGHDPDDMLLCECEMVPESAIEEIVGYFEVFKKKADLLGIGKRSRIGKGSCQGSLCSIRIAAYLYDHGYITGDMGIDNIKAFLNGRWKGKRCLLWDVPMIQSELQEALHCGLLGMELQ